MRKHFKRGECPAQGHPAGKGGCAFQVTAGAPDPETVSESQAAVTVTFLRVESVKGGFLEEVEPEPGLVRLGEERKGIPD